MRLANIGPAHVGAKPADSVLEPLIQRLVADFHLPPVAFHPFVGGRQVDFCVIGAPIVIECHESTPQDRDRIDDEFAAHGWIVLRFDKRMIDEQSAQVANEIRTAIASWTDTTAYRATQDHRTGSQNP
ncbi:MAG: DUF559 domain-containing protein [Ilumatobacter sp.]